MRDIDMNYENNTKTDIIWGAYDIGEDVHVIPEIEIDVPLPPHIFEVECPCHPSIEIEDETMLVIHNMIH
jgi:hypothetical protein